MLKSIRNAPNKGLEIHMNREGFKAPQKCMVPKRGAAWLHQVSEQTSLATQEWA
jgi:hypothetical protein